MFLAYYAPLCRFVRYYVKSNDIAEELIQDLFTRVWEIRKHWNPSNSVKRYLYKAARNRALDYLKHRRIQEKYDQAEGPFSEGIDLMAGPSVLLDEEIYEKDFLAAAQEAIGQLPERCGLIYRLHRQDGLTYREIAAVLDISVKTVETQMVRALKILRKRLAPFLPILAIAHILGETFLQRP